MWWHCNACGGDAAYTEATCPQCEGRPEGAHVITFVLMGDQSALRVIQRGDGPQDLLGAIERAVRSLGPDRNVIIPLFSERGGNILGVIAKVKDGGVEWGYWHCGAGGQPSRTFSLAGE